MSTYNSPTASPPTSHSFDVKTIATYAMYAVIVVLLILIIYFEFVTGGKAKVVQYIPILQNVPAFAKDSMMSPEQKAQKESAEYFTQCDSMVMTQKDIGCACGDATGEYNDKPFGMGNGSYSDWMAGHTLSPEIMKNHNEFISDRGNTANVLGRTWSPDMNTSVEYIPWQGLRRPEAVPVCNPTQVPDVDYDWFAKKPTISWSTGCTTCY
jgi:hypothetical protein